MSPWEMWVEYYPEIDVVGESFREQQRSTVRYLRADLTCGECRLRDTLSCGHWAHVIDCDGLDIYPIPDITAPACMKFQPTEIDDVEIMASCQSSVEGGYVPEKIIHEAEEVDSYARLSFDIRRKR